MMEYVPFLINCYTHWLKDFPTQDCDFLVIMCYFSYYVIS